MDPVVTARVPEEVRNRGNAILREINSTPSELINAAYEFVIREKRLPRPETVLQTGERRLSDAQSADLTGFLHAVRTPVPAEWEGRSFDDLFDEAMGSKYASLR